MTHALERFKKTSGDGPSATLDLDDWNGLLDTVGPLLAQLIQKGADFDAVSATVLGVLLDRINGVLSPAYDQVAARGAQVEQLYAQLTGQGVSAAAVLETTDRLFLTPDRRAAILTELRGVVDAAHDTLGELAALVDAATAAAASKADAALTATALSNRLRGDADGGYSTTARNRFLANLGLGAFTLGQCRLVYVSATELRLMPCRGNQVFHNGAFVTIPAVGLPLANTGLGFGTLQRVFLAGAAGSLALEAATTARATDATYGHEIKLNDATRTYVGMAYMDGTAGTGTFLDTPARRYVASWHNRPVRVLQGANNQTPGTASSNFVDLTGALYIYVLLHADEIVDFAVTGYNNTDTSNAYPDTTLAVDGGQVGTFTRNQAFAPGANTPVHNRFTTSLAEGRHYLHVLGRNGGGGSSTWTIQIYGTIAVPGN